MWYKRSIYLIDPKFQLRLGLFISSLVFIISLVYPLSIYELFRNLYIQLSSNSPGNASIYESNKISLILALVVYQLSFVAIVFAVCIFQGHKIAGPMFKLKRHLKGIAEGNQIHELSFRKGDHFQDVAEAINETFEVLKNNHNKDFAYLSEITAYIKNLTFITPDDKKIVLNEIIRKLEEIQNRFNPL